jgi:hypothetical protein
MDILIRKLTRMAYDVQELRIATGLRIVAQFNSRFKNLRTADESDKDAVDRERDKLLKMIVESYERVTDGVAATARKKLYKFDDILTNETEIWFVENYLDILQQEEAAFTRLAKSLKTFPFYTEYLEKVRGIGPAMAGVIISELDPHKAKYPSSFWKFCGLDVVAVNDKETGEVRYEGRSRREAHLVQVEYIDKHGNKAVRRGISYNPWLKSKLLAVLGPSFLRAGNQHYVKIYQDYKTRMLNRPELQGNVAIKAISHKRALRYMVKMFLIDLHMAWRAHEGLEVSVPYHEAKLGLTHGRDPSVEAMVNKTVAAPAASVPEPMPVVEASAVPAKKTRKKKAAPPPEVSPAEALAVDERQHELPLEAAPEPKKRGRKPKAVPAILQPKAAK